MVQSQENDENPHFGPALDLLDPNSAYQFFFSSNV